MRPLDPRLLHHARPARGYIALTTGFGIFSAALVIAQALLIAGILAPVITRGAALEQTFVLALAAVIVARALLIGAQERFAHRAATRVIATLRQQVVARAARLGPRWSAAGHGPATVTLATSGLEALEPYFVRYLPQLLLALTLTPATLAVVLGLDWIAALTIAITIPLVPLFMILVGQLTRGVSERRLVVIQRLGAQVLDLIAGLPTLRAFGRERGPAARVRALGEAQRRATMGTLRVAFLSGMVLELLTTLSVALVAVGVGLRLVYGELDLETGLAVLILAPEVYLPLRQVGLHFHASTDGIAAAQRAFAILEEPEPTPGQRPAPDLAHTSIVLNEVSVQAPGRATIAPASLSARIDPGRVVALTGASGGGKSTTVLALLGLVRPDGGAITLETRDAHADLRELEPRSWLDQITWVPQRPLLPPGSVRDAVLGSTPPSSSALAEAARQTGLDRVVAALPAGWHTPIGRGGHGLSVGQRQRIALTRALLDDRPLVILDEPTAHLDAASERDILEAVSALRARGRTVVVVAHRPALVALADDVIEVSDAPLARAA